MKPLPLALASLALLAGTADASFYNGNDLHGWCGTTPAEPGYNSDRAQCMGYVVGLVDGLTGIGTAGDALCLEGKTAAQVTDVVAKNLRDHPAGRDRLGVDVVFFALLQAFPCDDD